MAAASPYQLGPRRHQPGPAEGALRILGAPGLEQRVADGQELLDGARHVALGGAGLGQPHAVPCVVGLGGHQALVDRACLAVAARLEEALGGVQQLRALLPHQLLPEVEVAHAREGLGPLGVELLEHEDGHRLGKKPEAAYWSATLSK
jgi:hypothetical protein